MENIIYERDYSEVYRPPCKNGNITTSVISLLEDRGFFRFYGAFVDQIPKMVVPENRRTYERLLKRCDEWAQQNGGKIYAIIDYEKWDSKIKLTLPFVEFVLDDEMELLQDIAQNTRSVCFDLSDDGNSIVMTIFISYFEEIPIDENDMETMLSLAAAAKEQLGLPWDDDLGIGQAEALFQDLWMEEEAEALFQDLWMEEEAE